MDRKVEQAKQALETVFSDTSVGQETKLKKLAELLDHIEIMIQVIKEDL